MNFKIKIFLSTLILVLGSAPCWAHHPSGGGQSSGYTSFSSLGIQGAVTKPNSRAFFLGELNQLDDGVGQLYRFSLGGELALSRKWSLGGMLPLQSLDHNFRNSKRGLGDISIYGRFQAFAWSRGAVIVQSGFSFPTGDENSGLGSGRVGHNTVGSLVLQLGDWSWYSSTGVMYLMNSSPEPEWRISTGLETPSVFGNRVRFSLSVENQMYFRSAVFSDGSGKMFLMPRAQVALNRSERMLISAGVRVSIYDYLSKASGVTLTNTDNALLSDVLVAGDLAFIVQFK